VFYTGIIAQSITIDDNSRDASQLVHYWEILVQRHQTFLFHLVNQPPISTITIQHFYKEGVIIRNGIAKYSEGKYTGNNLSSQLNNNSDFELQKISNSTGQNIPITDVAYLEFDFVPLSNKFSFIFICF
jgi:hypothetical protein